MEKRLPTDQEIRNLFVSQCASHQQDIAAYAGENIGGYTNGGANIMEHSELNRIAALNGMENPDYVNNPIEVYKCVQLALGATHKGQWIPLNPLTMQARGYDEHFTRSATTGVEEIVRDGMVIADPDDVVEHMERFVFPNLEKRIAEYDHEARVREIGLSEYNQQMEMGLEFLKVPSGFITFPKFGYNEYGYVNYFSAYALYEDVIAKHFRLQAELARKNNLAAAEAINRYHLPKYFNLDHDMADSRSTLVNIRSLEKIWFPQLDYSLQPIHDKVTDMRLSWHCDGNIMPMVPGLIEVGVRGFQGFQYEFGVDLKHLCSLRGRDGRPLYIKAGVSVTTTLPFGTPADVRREMDEIVGIHGDAVLSLGCTSSVTPGVPSANLDALIEGLNYYRNHLK